MPVFQVSRGCFFLFLALIVLVNSVALQKWELEGALNLGRRLSASIADGYARKHE